MSYNQTRMTVLDPLGETLVVTSSGYDPYVDFIPVGNNLYAYLTWYGTNSQAAWEGIYLAGTTTNLTHVNPLIFDGTYQVPGGPTLNTYHPDPAVPFLAAHSVGTYSDGNNNKYHLAKFYADRLHVAAVNYAGIGVQEIWYITLDEAHQYVSDQTITRSLSLVGNTIDNSEFDTIEVADAQAVIQLDTGTALVTIPEAAPWRGVRTGAVIAPANFAAGPLIMRQVDTADDPSPFTLPTNASLQSVFGDTDNGVAVVARLPYSPAAGGTPHLLAAYLADPKVIETIAPNLIADLLGIDARFN